MNEGTENIIFFDEIGKEYNKPGDRKVTWRISGYALIVSDEGRILMVQPTWNTTWELPGGEIELDETIPEGITRECFEETGYRVSVDDKLITHEERNFYSRLADRYYKAIIFVYSGCLQSKIQHKEVINTVEKDEIAKVAWVPMNHLKAQTVHPIAWPAVSVYMQTWVGNSKR